MYKYVSFTFSSAKLIDKVEENWSTKPLKVRDFIASKCKKLLDKKLGNCFNCLSDVPFCSFMDKERLALTLWPQKALRATDVTFILSLLYGWGFENFLLEQIVIK